MRKTLMLAGFLVATSITIHAQPSEEQAVTETIHNLFTAMQKNDTVLFRSVFADAVTMATVAKNKEGKTVLIRETGIDGFVKAISKPNPNGALNEEIWNVRIQVDGALAQAWCDYAFYIGKTFSHCGVDAFQLVKTENGWKIFHLADTRRKDNCNIPAEITHKYK